MNQGERVQSSRHNITVADYGEWVVQVEACNDSGCSHPANQRFKVAQVNHAHEAMIQSTHASWEVIPFFTVGERIGDYSPPGKPDGTGAFMLNANTIRVLTNHELHSTDGYPYQLANGTSLTGSRISYLDIDRSTLEIRAAGLAYDTIVDRYGRILTGSSTASRGLRRLCSALFAAHGTFSLVDDIYFTGEEVGGGQLFALDVATNVLYAVPAAGRAAYENVALVDTGDPSTVGFLIGDDRGGAPLLLYVGNKNAIGDGSFLDRNGLAEGALYTWVSDQGDVSPEDFGQTGESRTGRFVEIEVLNPSQAGNKNHDSTGYVSQRLQDALSFGSEERGIDGVGAHIFSRPEDLAVNPVNSAQVVLNSTGFSSRFPSDKWGTVYVIDIDFSDMTADIEIVYSGDDAGNGQFPDGPDFGLRNPDNLEWANDGYVYQQEDRDFGGFGKRSGREASIWQMDPDSGQMTRIAEVNRRAVPTGAIDVSPDAMGKWETSGVLDVTGLFGADSTILLVTVQAHSVRGPLIGGEDAHSQLVQGGQILLLRKLGSGRIPTGTPTDATLSALSLGNATLSPTFASATTAYMAGVDNDVSQVTVSPTLNDSNASYVVKIGSAVHSDGTVPLAVGVNSITVEVTAEDGQTTLTYTIFVTRAALAPSASADTVCLHGNTDARRECVLREILNELQETDAPLSQN